MNTTSTLYSNQLNHDMLEKLDMRLHVQENRYNFDLGDLFQLAARKNPKRSFLFVSKLLGKHIGVNPMIPRMTGALLANLVAECLDGKKIFSDEYLIDILKNEKWDSETLSFLSNQKVELSKPTLVVGFAETATGLGHSVFVPFSNAYFIHTTRDQIQDLQSVFTFEEEHSHATSHLCYASQENFFDAFERIVLVDDEITTGKTALNLIEALNKQHPNKEYVVVSILDWRSKEEEERFQKVSHEFGCPIHVVSLVKGTVECANQMLQMEEQESTFYSSPIKVTKVPLELLEKEKKSYQVLTEDHQVKQRFYFDHTGRFGISANAQKELEQTALIFAEEIENHRKYTNTATIGAGELIFLPSMIASYLSGNVKYQSSTRSPIYVHTDNGYPLQDKIVFKNPDDHSITNFIYNITSKSYEEVILFFEREISENDISFFTEQFAQRGIKHLIICYFE